MFQFLKKKNTKEQGNQVINYQENSNDKPNLELIIKGTALGDIAGRPYEGVHMDWDMANFDLDNLYPENLIYTDDTILSVATADAILHGYSFSDRYSKYAHKYPCPAGGYGTHFIMWAMSSMKRPYNSCGNGSAMRVSPVAAFVKTIEECDKLAEQSAKVTHNHPEGIKGAVATAHMVFMAIHGAKKEDIVEYGILQYPESSKYIKKKFNKPVKNENKFCILCQDIMPLVISSFANTDSFESCLCDIIRQGGDTDTQAAIVGAIASAYYKTFSDESNRIWDVIKKDKIMDIIL